MRPPKRPYSGRPRLYADRYMQFTARKSILMKFSALSLLFLFSSSAFAQKESYHTQLEMNFAFMRAYDDADSILNATYRQVQQIYSSDSLFLQDLKTAQRAWIAFRDAQMAMTFPKREDSAFRGSIEPTCYWNEKTMLTQDRINQLKQWINGVEQGELCGGTRRIRK